MDANASVSMDGGLNASDSMEDLPNSSDTSDDNSSTGGCRCPGPEEVPPGEPEGPSGDGQEATHNCTLRASATVKLRMNSLRAVCTDPAQCRFNFCAEMALPVMSITPSEGSPAVGMETALSVTMRHGTYNLTKDNVRVYFGPYECPVNASSVSGNFTTLTVPICSFPASTQPVHVYVAPLGYALHASPYTGSLFTFKQLLLLHSVSPLQSSPCGGTVLTVTGTGFTAQAPITYPAENQNYGFPEPEPEAEPESEPESESESESEGRTTTAGGRPVQANEVVVCSGDFNASTTGQEPESGHGYEGVAPRCLPCKVLTASTTEITCVAPPGAANVTHHVRARVVDPSSMTQGLRTRYFVPVFQGARPALEQIVRQIHFDGSWPAVQGFQAGQGFELRMDGYLYVATCGLYEFKIEANGARHLSLNGQDLVADAGTGLDEVGMASSGETYLYDGPHFLALRYVGFRSHRLFLKLSYRGPDTAFQWTTVPASALTPPGDVGSGTENWMLSRQGFSYLAGPTLHNLTLRQGSMELELAGAGLGTTEGYVYIGSSLLPRANFPCAVQSWSDTAVRCTFRPLPAGTWQVRAFVPGSGWACGPLLAFGLNASVSSVSDFGGGTATGPSDVLPGGHAGGVELSIRGANLGLHAGQVEVSVGSTRCAVTESGINLTRCTTQPYTTREVVEAIPAAFPWQNLAGAAGAAFFSDLGAAPVEAAQAHGMLLANRKDEMLNLEYGGALRMRSGSDSCYFGFGLPATKQALLYEVAAFPPVHPERRKRVRTSLLQAQLGGGPSWTTVAKFEDIEVQGATIAQGWTVFAISPPVLAQRFRVVLGPDACSRDDSVPGYPSAFATELVRGVRFEGVLLDVGPATVSVGLARVRHPLALAGWEQGLEVGQLEHSVNRTPVLSCPISPSQGTARGGTPVTVCGENLAPLLADGSEPTGEAGAAYVKVWLNGYPCTATEANDTAVGCTTTPRVNGITPSSTRVSVAGKGYALSLGVEEDKHFQYIDRWSDPLSWSDSNFPVEGDSVSVPEGQAILLDKDSPRLFLLLIQGTMEFDRRDLVLEATYIWVAGGRLKIGSEERPFLQQATIRMYGERWNTIELPFVGSKMIAVTNRGGLGGGCHRGGSKKSLGSHDVPRHCQVQSVGRLDLHGRPDVSWTRLVRTARPGASSLSLAEPVAWPAGSQVLITPSQRGRGEEVRRVAEVTGGGYTVVLDRPLRHEHLGTWYWHPNISGPTDLRAAVGLQTKNIRIRANESALYGRNNDFLFGVAVHAFFGGELRIENVEFTMTGQAANFGRYSSHWHNLSPGRNVDVADKAYLRNNSYHDTFQRCVVVHGTDYAVVRDNVCHKSHGHGFFTEAGDEDFLLLEHNLAVNALPHHLLLDDDVDASGFWLPGFTGWHRHNLAANCIRGWRVRRIAGGAAQTDLTFFNNSAHACGFGWHLKPPHAPPTLNHFKSFTAFRCGMGMFYYGTGNIVHEDHRFVECSTGHLNNHFFNGLHQAPFYLDSYLVGNIDLDPDGVGAGHFDGSGLAAPTPQGPCKSRVSLGFRWGKDGENMLISGMTVVNFCDTPVMLGCFINACTMRFERWLPIHTYKYTTSKSYKSGIYWDLDGSLTGWVNGFVTWDEPSLHWPHLCDWSQREHHNGIKCGHADGTLRLRRLTVNNLEPSQLRGKRLRVQTAAGQSAIRWDWKEMTWEVPVVSYLNGSSACPGGGVDALEYDMWPEVWNTFQRISFNYAKGDYVTAQHGYNHWLMGYYRTKVTPTSEAVRLNLNFTRDWRNHFDVSGAPRLRRRPELCQDPFGAHAMRLWKDQCDEYDWSEFELENNTYNLSLSMAEGADCATHPAPTCAGPNELCYYDEACNGTGAPPAGCIAGGAGRGCRFCGRPRAEGGSCPASTYEMGVSRGACNGGWTNESGWPLRSKLRQEPQISQVGGQFTALLAARVESTAARQGCRQGSDGQMTGCPGSFRMTVQGNLCPPGGCPRPPPAPAPPPATPSFYKKWSDPTTWPGGRVPRHLDNVRIDFQACFDSAASMGDGVVLNWVTVVPGASLEIGTDCEGGAPRRLGAGGQQHLRLNVRSLIVWGTLQIGTPERPVPLGSSVTIAFYGGLFSHTVIATEGLFVRNKALVVLGHLEAHGSVVRGTGGRRLAEARTPSRTGKIWKRLHATALRGSRQLVIRGDAGDWPLGKKVAVSPTEYPRPPDRTETDVSLLAGVEYDHATDTSILNLTDALNYTHYAGVVHDRKLMNGHWDRVELTAYVTLLEGRSNILFTTGETDQELIDLSTDNSLGYPESQGHGGTVVVGGSLDGSLFGSVNLSNVDFVRMGKRNLEHGALWFYYPGGPGKGNASKGSRVENCVFSQLMSGGIEIAGVGRAGLSIVGNIMHSTARYGIWAVGPFRKTGASQKGDKPLNVNDHIEVRDNFVLDNIRSPFDDHDALVEPFYRPYGSFILEIRPRNFMGNIAAGSTDIGFTFRPPLVSCSAPWAPPVEEPLNEAVGCVVGFFVLRATKGAPASSCVSLHGVYAWKNSHFGVLTVDQSHSMRVDQVVVSDNFVGISLNFAVLTGGRSSMDHRIYGHNVTIFGSTPATSCSSSLDCRAVSSADPDGRSCSSVLDSRFGRVGMLLHMVTGAGKTCELSGMADICDSPHMWFKMCAGPWEQRRGSLGARYSEAHWDKVSFGYFNEPACSEHQGRWSYAITYNPTSIDFSFPNHFSDSKFLADMDTTKKFYLMPGQAGCSRCDGLWQLGLVDVDGSLVGGGAPRGSIIGGANTGLAKDTCTQSGASFTCGHKDSPLYLNKLTWEPIKAAAEENRVLGLFKALRVSDDRAVVSEGPHKNMCPTDKAPHSRSWLVAPGEIYNLTMFASPPKSHAFYYFNDRDECLELRLRLTQPFRLDVYVDNRLLDENNYDTARSSATPRIPTLASNDPHGSYTFDPHERTIFFIVCGGRFNGKPATLGGGWVMLKLIQVVQLSMTVSVRAEDFDQDKQRTFVENIGLLLKIPSWRIKIVSVQNIGVRRRLQQPDPLAEAQALGRSLSATRTEVITQILPASEAASAGANGTNGTNATGGDAASLAGGSFDLADMEELQQLALVVQNMAATGAFANACNGLGMSCQLEEVSVSNPTTTTTTTTATTTTAAANGTAATTETTASATLNGTVPSETTTGTVTEVEEADTTLSIVVGVCVGALLGFAAMILGIVCYVRATEPVLPESGGQFKGDSIAAPNAEPDVMPVAVNVGDLSSEQSLGSINRLTPVHLEEVAPEDEDEEPSEQSGFFTLPCEAWKAKPLQ